MCVYDKHEESVVVCVEPRCLLVSPVSMMATQEYDGMKEELDLEQNLRVKAETYAHEVTIQTHSAIAV